MHNFYFYSSTGGSHQKVEPVFVPIEVGGHGGGFGGGYGGGMGMGMDWWW